MRIVVRGTNWIGDAVMSVPAMRELRRLFPDAFIVLHTRAWAKDIFADSVLFDEIIPIDQTGNKAAASLRQAEELRKRNFDAALLFTNSFATAFIARVGRVRRRFGYETDGRSFLLSDSVPVPPWKNERHEVYYYLNLVSEFGQRLTGAKPEIMKNPATNIPVSECRRREARELLNRSGAHPGPIVALAAGSTNSRAKRWGVENFAALNDRLQEELGANVLLLGAADEAHNSCRVSASARHKPIDLTGKTTLAEAAAVLAEADMMVSNDMGLAHLAPAVGTETLAIFGPTNHVTTRPFSPLAEVIRAGVECSPCMLRDCPIDHRCMTRISAAQVFERVRGKLGPS